MQSVRLGDWKKRQQIEEHIPSPSEAGKSFFQGDIGQISILWHRPSGYSGLAVSLQFKASKKLKEVYIAFKDTFPSQKIGLSKFAELRPPHYAGASGSHSVCVCVHNTSKC